MHKKQKMQLFNNFLQKMQNKRKIIGVLPKAEKEVTGMLR
jgi:hypothetical protein